MLNENDYEKTLAFTFSLLKWQWGIWSSRVALWQLMSLLTEFNALF